MTTARSWPDHLLSLDEWGALDSELGPPPTVRKPAALEILSPGSRRTDRVAKLAEYAEGGVPHDGVVDPEGPTLTEFVLVDGVYRLVTEHRGGAVLGFGATLDLTALRQPPRTDPASWAKIGG